MALLTDNFDILVQEIDGVAHVFSLINCKICRVFLWLEKSTQSDGWKKRRIIFNCHVVMNISFYNYWYTNKCRIKNVLWVVSLVSSTYTTDKQLLLIEGASEWLLYNVNSVFFQLYHGENKLIFNEMMMRSSFY
jgi:arabinogalactan endo-1,4-beta-galactosidase